MSKTISVKGQSNDTLALKRRDALKKQPQEFFTEGEKTLETTTAKVVLPISKQADTIVKDVADLKTDEKNKKQPKNGYDIFLKYINIDSYIGYLMSILELKDFFSNDSITSNYKADTLFPINFLKQHYKSSGMREFFKDNEKKQKSGVTVKELINGLFLIQDTDRKGSHDEIFLSIMKLLGCTFDVNKLPDYNTIKNKKDLVPYYNWIKPRFETRVLAYFKYRIYNEPLIKFISKKDKDAIPILQSYFRFTNQYKIKRDCTMDQRKYKFYDLGLEIKTGKAVEAFTCKLLLEVQENNKGHIDNPNDDEKKALAIRNKMQIMYYRQHEYKKDASSLSRKYGEYFTYLQALLLNADIQCRREYLKFKYTQSYKTHKEILDNELKDCKDKVRIAEIKVALQNIDRKIKSEDTLLMILNWKEQSQNALENSKITMHGDNPLIKVDNLNNDVKSNMIKQFNEDIFLLQNDNPVCRVIALDENFLDVTQIREKDLKNDIIPTYTKNNLIKLDKGIYYVSWQSLVQIIGDYALENIKATLLQYLTNVESVYERIIKLKDFYQSFKDDLTDWKHTFELIERKEDYSNETKDYINTIAMQKLIIKQLIREYNSLKEEYKDLVADSVGALEVLNNEKVLDKFNNPNKKYIPIHTFKHRVDQAFDFKHIENIENHVYSKKVHKIKSNKYVFNNTDGEVIYTNRPDVNIKFKLNNYKQIPYGIALLINLSFDVPETTFVKYIRECIDDDIELNSNTLINNLEIEQSLLDKFSNEDQNKNTQTDNSLEHKNFDKEAEEETDEEDEEDDEDEEDEEADDEDDKEASNDNSNNESNNGSDYESANSSSENEDDELTNLTNI